MTTRGSGRLSVYQNTNGVGTLPPLGVSLPSCSVSPMRAWFQPDRLAPAGVGDTLLQQLGLFAGGGEILR